MNDQIQKITENGIAWAMNAFNMTEQEVLELLEQHGKGPCNVCTRISDVTALDENGMCRRCGCATCQD